MPGPSSSTESTTSPLRRSTVASTAVPGIGVAQRVLEQVERRAGAARRARRRSRRPGARADADAGGRPRPARARRPPRSTTSERSTGTCARDAAGVGAREQQQVGDEPAHAARGAQGGGGGLARLALELHLEQLEVGEHRGQRRAQLVRRVGDELALARERRPRSRCAPRRARGACSRASAPARTTSSLRLRVRDRQRRVARARDRARRVGQPRDRRHRAASRWPARRAAPAPRRRARRGRGTRARGWRSPRRRRACARTGRRRRRAPRSSIGARLDPVAVELLRRARAAAAGTARSRCCAITLAVARSRSGSRRPGCAA